MISKLHKKILALSLAGCMLVTAVQWPMATKAQTETESAAEDFVLTDDFSDAEHTKSMWSTFESNTTIDGETLKIKGNNKFYVADSVWKEGYKPVKLCFKANTLEESNANDDGLRVQLLNTDDVQLYFKINTEQWGTYNGFEYSGTGVTMKYDGNEVTNQRFYDQDTSLQSTEVLIAYTFAYDWSKWESDSTVLVSVQAVNTSGIGKAIHTISFTWSENKPENFKVGFSSTSKGSSRLDDIKIKYSAPENELKAALAEKYNAFVEQKSYQTASAFMNVYQLMSDVTKPDFTEQYKDVCEWIKGEATDTLSTVVYTDDFSNSFKTNVLWDNELDELITEDSDIQFDGITTSYMISDNVWADGNKPKEFSFEAHTVDKNTNDDGFEVQILKTDTADIRFRFNTIQENGYHRYNTTGFDKNNTRIFQNSSTTLGNNTDMFVKYSFSYDWSKWDTNKQVTIKLTIQKGESSFTDTQTFTCSAEGELTTFKAGFKNVVGNQTKVDNVKVFVQLGDAALKEKLQSAYQSFQAEKTYKNARAVVELYKCLTVEAQETVSTMYTTVWNWMKADTYVDDFSDLDKTAAMWTNNLQDKVSEGTVQLSGNQDVYLLADEMYVDSKLMQYSVTMHENEMYSKWNDKNGGVCIRLLEAEDACLNFICNTEQSGSYVGFYTSGGNLGDENGDIRIWKDYAAGIAQKGTSYTVVCSYDWSKWESDSEIGIKVEIITATGKSLAGVYSATYKYTGNSKPTVFKTGLKCNSTVSSYTVERVEMKFQTSDAESLKSVLAERFNTFKTTPSYSNANNYMKIYNRILNDVGESCLDTSEKDHYQKVCEWLQKQDKAFEDDFSNPDKTGVMWTNGLQDKISENAEAEIAGTKKTYLISDAVWNENNRPTEFSFTAYTKYQFQENSGLKLLLLSSDVVGVQVTMGTWQSYGYHNCTVSGFITDLDNVRLWKTGSLQISEEYVGTVANAYTFTYDWSKWDSAGVVTIQCKAVSGEKNTTETATIVATYSGDEANKPNTFKVGFANENNNTVVDNVKISYENPSTVLTAKGATISTNLDEGTMLRFGFDYSAMREHMTRNGEELVNYGAILVAKEATDAATMKAQLKTLHESATDKKFATTTYSTDNKFMVTVGNVNATRVPNNYNVDIKGSDNIDQGYIDKEICAVGYVITKSTDNTYHYYFTNTVDNEKSIEGGRVKKSVMNLLTAANKELVSVYDKANDADKSAFETKVTEFKSNDSDTHTYTMDEYKAVVNGTELTLDGKVQKQWLRYVFLQTQAK